MFELPDKLLGCSGGPPLVEVCDGGFTRGVDSRGGNDIAANYPPSGTYFTNENWRRQMKLPVEGYEVIEKKKLLSDANHGTLVMES